MQTEEKQSDKKKVPKPHTIQDLNQLFSEGETADQELFAEQRSNVQLVAGEHYAKKGNKFFNRLRDSKDVSSEQKIRLTKNHIRKIVLTYRNSIVSYAPGVQAVAKDKTSMQHQKSSELVNSVWADGKARHDFNSKINQWAHDYCSIGEFAVKGYFDPNAGKFLGMEAEMDEETGQVKLDEETGQPVPSGVARFAGDVILERLFAFNIIRPAGLRDMERTPWLCHRKMARVDEVKGLIDASQSLSDEEKEDLKKKVHESADQTYVVLDGSTGQYRQVKDQTMLKEWFFKPSPQYPKGYFYICTNDDIIFKDELPFGIWPIVFKGFDEIQTSPRYRSIVKQLRPNQIEINRASSKMAEHQITLGDDKVLVQNGTKLAPGTAYPGVRSYQYSGQAPIIMAGRTGDQYLSYISANISEMYQIAMVDEQNQEKAGPTDVYAMLARSLKEKKKFTLYTDTFESGLKEIFKLYTTLCQKYLTSQHLIPMIGKSEYINIDEFKNVDDLTYSITAEAQSDDSEKKVGKQLMLNHLIQYVGPQLAKDDLGKIIRLMPYANDEQILEDLTMDYDYATNYMLQLDRGQTPPPNAYINQTYLIKKLTNRTTKPDYQFLNPQIQNNYQQAIQTHEQIKSQDEIKIKQAQSEFIPTSGYLVACDFYVPDPANPQKLPKRVRLPSEALSWLINQLDSQGSDQKTLEGLNQGAQTDMANTILSKLGMLGGQQGPGAMMPQRPMGPPQVNIPQMTGQPHPGIGMQHGN